MLSASNTHTNLQYHQTSVVRRAIVLEMSAERYTPTISDIPKRNEIDFSSCLNEGLKLK